jgi:hypothetical protein
MGRLFAGAMPTDISESDDIVFMEIGTGLDLDALHY